MLVDSQDYPQLDVSRDLTQQSKHLYSQYFIQKFWQAGTVQKTSVKLELCTNAPKGSRGAIRKRISVNLDVLLARELLDTERDSRHRTKPVLQLISNNRLRLRTIHRLRQVIFCWTELWHHYLLLVTLGSLLDTQVTYKQPSHWAEGLSPRRLWSHRYPPWWWRTPPRRCCCPRQWTTGSWQPSLARVGSVWHTGGTGGSVRKILNTGVDRNTSSASLLTNSSCEKSKHPQ